MKLLYTALLIAIIIATIIHIYKSNKTVEINHYIVPVGKDKIKKEIKIAHLSDLHICQWTKPNFLKAIIEKINRWKPDYFIITGDIVTHYKEMIPQCCQVLSLMKPIKKSIVVMGNHDYWVDGEYLIAAIKDEGITVLRNENFIDSENGFFCAGIDDPFTHRDDIKKALKDRPKNMLTLLLAHSPDIYKEAQKEKVDLLLVGHTHGGQIRFPFIGALYIPVVIGKKYDQGWFLENKTLIFINRGFGVIFPPYRFLCPREIALLTLTPKEGKPQKIKREIFVKP